MDLKTEEWVPLEKSRVPAVLKKINSFHHDELFNPDSTFLRCRPSPFFPGWKELKATDHNWHPSLCMHFMMLGLKIIKLDGTARPLEILCGETSPVLNAGNAFEYARFYLGEQMLEEGNPRLVADFGELEFCRDPQERELAQLQEALHPPEVLPAGKGFTIRCILLYGSDVFDVTLAITPSGKVELVEEKLLLQDMPTNQIFLL